MDPRARRQLRLSAQAVGLALVIAAVMIVIAALGGRLLRQHSAPVTAARLSATPAASPTPTVSATPAASAALTAGQQCREANADPGLAPFGGQIVPDGPYVWVFGAHGVSQFGAGSGRPLRTISECSFDTGPAVVAAAASGQSIWVLNGESLVTSFSNVTGALTGAVIAPKQIVGDPPLSPGAIATTGQLLWIDSAGSVTEYSATTGAALRNIPYGVQSPFGSIAAAGARVWIASLEGGPGGGGALAEVASPSGRLIRTVSGPAVADPFALAVAGRQLWIIGDRNDPRPQLTEVDAATGSVIRTISDARYGFHGPFALAVSDGIVWVLSYDSVTLINAATGALMRVERGSSDGLATPQDIAAVGNRIWITNLGGQTSLSEYDARTGALLATVSGPA
jgi:hypothetical protein